MNFKSIDLVLENCEVITVERKYMGHLYMSNFNTTISRHDKKLLSSEVVNEFAIEIHRSLDETTNKQGLFDKYSPIERLRKYSDITQIEITYEDNSKKHVYTHWHDEDEYDNRYQKSKLNNFGDLYIVISEAKDIDYYFQDETINDSDMVEWNWDNFKEGKL
ncbi:hypothetical protein AF332_11605 [Sporosarcina globispora]|uniref:Uncharacterized protein n=1 Tax=Sporosarcina globispora TaxID=1459 RepID=A0A0M0GCB7_SPOGL|nr:hypothetical protein [Sporosarcina globispora]KON87408.1 hypothetical protein AF332_11605 [Sporosarcina globispora]